jgi:hypothetical protein
MQKYAGYGPIVMSPDGGTVDDGEIRIAASMSRDGSWYTEVQLQSIYRIPADFFFETLPHDIFSETLPPLLLWRDDMREEESDSRVGEREGHRRRWQNGRGGYYNYYDTPL